jgi:uncharacterized protein (DUF58 family)
MNLALRRQLGAWLLRSRGFDAAPVRLTQRRIFILPTQAGMLLALTLMLMLLGCINYNLGLGYVLTFLLAAIAIVSMLHTFRNLAQLEVHPGRAQAVFAGDTAVFPVLLRNPTALPRIAVGLAAVDAANLGSTATPASDWRDIPPSETTTAEVRVPAHQRGRLHLPRLRIFCVFPLGLFYTWSRLHLDMSCLVYPKPESGLVPLPPTREGAGEGMQAGRGQEDFAGLRRYQPGDSMRHIAWKALARGQEMVTKQFTGSGVGELWLSWSHLPPEMGLEARLSRLTRWVVDAAREGRPYGLELPGTQIPPDTGAAHEERCLGALALFKGAKP